MAEEKKKKVESIPNKLLIKLLEKNLKEDKELLARLQYL
jgi:hypothetical protein